MKAIAYVRVSGKGQVDGDGPDRQRESIKRFCAEHKLEFCAEAFEAGVSGTVEGMNRPAFSDAIQLVQAENLAAINDFSRPVEPRCIVVERMDRLARDLMVQELLLRECRERGVKIYAADQGLVDMASNDCDPSRKLIRQIMGAIAEWEKSVIVMKLRKARDRKRAATGACEGPKPYGSTSEEARTLAYMRTLRSRALKSYAYIAASANGIGFRTRFGKPWTAVRVFRVLNPPKKGPTMK